MGEMINNIAHQWRQPLNSVGLYVQSLLLHYDEGHFTREFLQSTSDETMKLIRHMSRTIDDFRDFFRSDKEMIEFSPEALVQMTVSLVHDGFTSNRIDIVSRVHDSPIIHGYFNQLCQVLLNILLNARDAIVERKIASGRVILDSAVEDGRAVILITDNAGGIPVEIIDRIFEPYFSTKGVQGTGIGLFMSKKIIENHMGGRITVRNTDDGAEFRIVI
jgi:signal transduction histidine kinase